MVGDSGRRKTCQEPGRPVPAAADTSARRDRLREHITAFGPGQESEGVIGARKPGNSGGAKGSCRTQGPEEGRRTAWGNPTTEFHLRTELSPSYVAKPGNRCMPRGERVRASRVRENCKHGLKRAEAAGYTAPPLLDRLLLRGVGHCVLGSRLPARILGQLTRRHLRDFRHMQASLHNPSMRRGGSIAIIRHDRFVRRVERNPSAAAATPAAQPYRNRIATEPKATLLQHKHAPHPAALYTFLQNLRDPT